MKTARERDYNPAAVPADWPNGSALCMPGSDPKRGVGLLGRTIRRNGLHAAWKYMGKNEYKYLGEFKDHLAAHRAITG